jgi:hypothetical protein
MLMSRHLLTVAILMPPILAIPADADARHTRQEYLDLAKAAYHAGLESCPATVQQWLETYRPDAEAGYAPPDDVIWFARLAAGLYDVTGDEQYAREAARWLAGHHRFKEQFPKELREQRLEYAGGLPTIVDCFSLPCFSRAYCEIEDSPALTPDQRREIEQSLAESADYVFDTHEWGPMNRATLRAEGLIWSAKALPDHPHAARWRLLADSLASDSWGRWSEEDSETYHPTWLGALIRYADGIEDRSLFDKITTRYYFEYFLHLLSPAGMVPEFGDARWNENWTEYIGCLERAATEYQNGEFKWGARQILETAVAQQRPVSNRSAVDLLDAYRCADDSIVPQEPPARSEEVLEDLVGKKIVFRSGWNGEATYLLLNYRDEGNFARLARDYLRNTIPVEEEKAHHGHADENSICLFMNQGAVLLDDAGYRDRIPSGPYGAFRADYFHNRLIVRRQKRDREQPLFEFLRYSGAYLPVVTDKIDFFTSQHVDVSRTRLTDEPRGYVADRVTAYLKPEDLFVVFDIIKILETDYYTFATLWHVPAVLDQGTNHFVTAADSGQAGLPPHDRALLIDFLQTGTRQTGVFPIRRHMQNELAVYQTLASRYYAGQIETFVTVLAPVDSVNNAEPLVRSVRLLEVSAARDGLGVSMDVGEHTLFLCVKTDLTKELLAENVRPRYTFDSGKVQYGPFETDAYFLYGRLAEKKLAYVATHMTKIRYQNQELFAAPPVTLTLLPDDLSTSHGAPKWRYWEGTVDLP